MIGEASGGSRPERPRRGAPLHLHLRSHLGRPHQRVAITFLLLAGLMIPWVVYLAVSLPPKYSAGHWRLAWLGFDSALVLTLAYGAWAAWFRRQILASTTLVAATLLLCDAWFDITTSFGHRDEWVTLVTGLLVEIPLAIFFIWLYRQIVLRTLAAYHEAVGDGEQVRAFRDARILFGADDTHDDAPPRRRPRLSG